MGSCENLTSVHEPSGDSVFERHSCLGFTEEPVSKQWLCLEISTDVVDANVSGSVRLDGCLGLSNDDATSCVGSADVGYTGIGNKDGLTAECKNAVGVLDGECGVSKVCFNESWGEIGVCNSLDRCLGLCRGRSNTCISSANVTEAVLGNRDWSVSECENVSCSVLEIMEDDEPGVCLNESQNEVDVCCAETNGSCLERKGFQGEDLESFEHWKLPLREMPNISSLTNCDRQGNQKDDQGVNLPSMEETVEVMEEETDVLSEVKVDNDNQTLLSDVLGMSLESMPVTGLPINCVQQHEQKGNNIFNSLSGEKGVMIEKSDTLAELEKDPCGQIVPSQNFEIPSDLKLVTGSPRHCVQQDEQKEIRSVSCPAPEGGMEDMEEKTDALDGIEKVNSAQILTSQFCEMPSKLLPLTGSPRNYVQQDEQDNGNSVGCSSEGDMEGKNEKTDALTGIMKVAYDQMLPLQFCEKSSEAVSLIDSPRNYVQLGDQENDKKDGSSSSEGLREVIEEKRGTCGLLSHGCSMPPDLTPSTDSLRNYASVGFQVDTCVCVLSLQDCEVPSESTPVAKERFIIEEKGAFVGGIEHYICHPRAPSEHIELPTELASSTGLSSSTTLQNERKGIESIGYADVEGKADASTAIEANMCNCISASQDAELPFKVSCEDDLIRTCEGRNLVGHETVGLLYVGTMEPKGNTDTCILSLPLQSYQSSLESLHIADSPSNSSLQTEQGNNKSVDGLSSEGVTESVEEKSGVTTDFKVEVCSQLSPIEEIIKESSTAAPNSFVEKPVSLQSFQPSAVGENGSCKSLDFTDLPQNDGFGGISSSSAVDSFGHIDHEGKGDVGANCFSETGYPKMVSSSSRRSSRISRSSLKRQSKRATRNWRTTTKVQQSHGCIDIIFSIARRKRSCLFKPARSSIWGLSGSIIQNFGNSDVSSLSLVQNQRSLKARGVHGSQKRDKVRAGGSSSRSSEKCNVSTRCLRLKVKMGKEICRSTLNVVIPEVVDTITGSDHIVVGDDETDSYPKKNYEFPKLAHEAEDILGEEGTERQFQCFKSNLEEHPDDSVLDVPLSNQGLKSAVIMDKSVGDVADDNTVHKVVELLRGASANSYGDPETSPDSEVINLAPDVEHGPRNQESLHKIVLTSSETFSALGNVNSSRRGKKITNLLFVGNSSLEDSSPVAASTNKVKPPKKRGGRQKLEDVSYCDDSLSAFPGASPSSHSSSGKEFCVEPLPSSREAEPGVIGEDMVPSIKSRGCALSKNLKSDGRKKERSKVSNCTKTRRKNASRQGVNQRKSVNKNKVKEKSVSDAKTRGKGVFESVEDKTEDQPQIGSHITDDIGKTDSGNNSVSVDVAILEIISGGEPEDYRPPESAWVRCDDCYKWRRIPVSLANSIDENCRWICKDNMDTTFADCSLPQEKTNAEINAELGLSDYEEDDGLLNYNRSSGLDYQSMAALPRSSFRRIDSNVFLHRTRKTQTIDEVMVCHCKPPSDGLFGCGVECLNRMLNIECVQGTCPSGDLCSNQQFQKRKYAKMQWRPCGKKGYGLQLLEHIPKGKFIIEYVGEVLDMQAYEARQKEYAATGHKHFYFMTLNGSEVIDACAKGNLGRFINHSCDPNCRTEKWMVNGEICIGLFAMRDIKEGEELTFDYNYVRVFGAAAKKCHCGSPQCRGYIGGDPLNTEIIYQGDSDEEYPEPLMLEDGETGDGFKSKSRTSSFYGNRKQISEIILKDTNKMDDSSRAVGQLEITGKVRDLENQSTSAISRLHNLMEMEDSKGKYLSLQSLETSLQVEDETSMPMSSFYQEVSKEETMKKNSSQIPLVDSSFPNMISLKLFPDGIDANRKSKSDIDNEGFLKSRSRIKTSRKSASVKKVKVNGSPLNVNKDKTMASKSHILPMKPKKLMEGSSIDRFEVVQEKLNELLDAEGGISKRKDYPKVYLKLLLLTAASGGSGNSESIQSNRDLSMILDALLKTKSRAVLMDVINKNGLQMLHNMIKQYRGDFKKIPILRKLLKVLEYLAVREILTWNHITAGPPCPGMESFRGSILSLTEHDDKQVHQIARSFRDRWIPKPFRKHSYMDRDDSGMDIHSGANSNRLPMLHNHPCDQGLRPSEAIDCVMQSLVATASVDTVVSEAGSSPGIGGCQTAVSKTRKRKSRWDQPVETNVDSIKLKEPKLIESRVLQIREDINCPDHIRNHCKKDDAVSSENRRITQWGFPPGFSSPFNPPLVSSDASSTTDLPQQNVSHLRCSFDVAIALPQEKFKSHLPVSYGIPLHILQQFGSPQAEIVDGWVMAPGMLFQPFPPLPPFPRDKKETPPACAVSCKTVNGPAKAWQHDSNHPPNCCPDKNNPGTTGANQSDADIPGTDTQHTFKRMRGSSNDLGKRYFRQQKWKGPPWLWRRNSYCS